MEAAEFAEKLRRCAPDTKKLGVYRVFCGFMSILPRKNRIAILN